MTEAVRTLCGVLSDAVVEAEMVKAGLKLVLIVPPAVVPETWILNVFVGTASDVGMVREGVHE